MEYQSAFFLKGGAGGEILTHAAIWTNLEDTVLGKINQTQKKTSSV
jgi:hypothetical protein